MLALEFGRMILALGLVLGLLWLFAKFGRGRQAKGRGRWQSGQDGARIEVVDRRSLGRHSSIAVIRAAGRVVVVGQTPQQINVLFDTPLEPAVSDDEGIPAAAALPGAADVTLMPGTALATGPDAPKAWDAFLERLREMTVRH